jgi:arylsulfatase A-like enzyme
MKLRQLALRSILLLAIGLSCLASTATATAADAQRPNVLFIAVDDLNDWIGCLGGNPDCKSPHIDALARRGVLFHQAHCAAPACNPSRVALLTGIRPSTSGIYINPQPWRPHMPDVVTLPQLFMQQDYEVLGGGKIFHGRYKDPASWQTYFDRGSDPKPSKQVLNDPHSRAGGIVWGELSVGDRAMADHRVVSWAIDYLKQEHEKPFFLACGIYRPHMPWQVPRKYYDMFPLDQITLPQVPDDDLADVPGPGVRIARPEGDHATIKRTDNWRHAVQAYLASIAFADAQVGRLMQALDESPHAKNTIVVLWGDHGWHLGEKQHWRKFALWEEATRAPLMMIVPGVSKPGGVCRQPVDFVNIYPTLADLCDLEMEKQLEGISLRPLLGEPDLVWERPAITTHGRNNHAIRSLDYRYIRYADGSEELYDHRSDPMEWKNLADDPAHAEAKAKLIRWLPQKNVPEAPREGGQSSKRAQPTVQQHVHVTPIETSDPYTWKYKLDLPEGKEYVLRMATEHIPRTGLPRDAMIAWAGLTAKDDTCTIRLSPTDSSWSASVDGGSLAHQLPPEHTRWLDEKWNTTYAIPAEKEYAADEIVTLLRARAVDPQTGTKSGAGLMIILHPLPKVIASPKGAPQEVAPDVDLVP